MKSNFSTFLLITFICGLFILSGCGPTENTSEKNNTATADKTEKPENDAGEIGETENNDSNSEPEKAVATDQPGEDGKEEKAFIPAGWKKIDAVKGDLNKDSLEDSVLQLGKKVSADDDDNDRMLIVLFKTKSGKFVKAGESTNLIQCSTCAGAIGSTKADVEIKNGVMIISQLSGSREATDHLQRFRFEPETKKFLLIGEDIKDFDRATGASTTTSTNYLTGKQVITKNQYNQETDKDDVVSKQEKNVKKTKKYLADF